MKIGNMGADLFLSTPNNSQGQLEGFGGFKGLLEQMIDGESELVKESTPKTKEIIGIFLDDELIELKDEQLDEEVEKLLNLMYLLQELYQSLSLSDEYLRLSDELQEGQIELQYLKTMISKAIAELPLDDLDNTSKALLNPSESNLNKEDILKTIEELADKLNSKKVPKESIDFTKTELANLKEKISYLEGTPDKGNKVVQHKPMANNLLFYRKPVVANKEVENTVEGQHQLEAKNFPVDFSVEQYSTEKLDHSIIQNPKPREINLNNIFKNISSELDKNIIILKRGEVTASKIKLYPEELGEVNVQLELVRGQLNVRIIASNEAAYNHLSESGKDLQQRFESTAFDEINLEFFMEDNLDDNSERHNFSSFFKGKNNTKEPLPEEEEEYLDLVQSAYNYKV